ncbi:MAG: complex I subunit 5 family protein, partial [Candidatus Promineifilaceae bacterium]
MADAWLLAPILIPLGAAFGLPLVRRLPAGLRALLCVLAMGLTLGVLLRFGPAVLRGETLVYWLGGWAPRAGAAVGISLSLDAWGWLVAVVVALVGLMATLYALVDMRGESGLGAFYVLVMLLMAGLIGFCLSGDLFNQFVWLEVFSVAGFALTAFHIDQPKAIEAAFKYLITNSLATFFVAMALILIYMQTGALNLAQVADSLEATPAGLVAVGLLIGGYATKAAILPWHFWLPDAHATAPAPVSAIFSGALIHVGIYAVGRTLYSLTPSPAEGVFQGVLLTVAGLSMLVGGLQMVQQSNIKRILAYSSVSQVGYIALGLGLGTPLGAAAAGLHLVSHALLKSSLFMG